MIFIGFTLKVCSYMSSVIPGFKGTLIEWYFPWPSPKESKLPEPGKKSSPY